MWKKQVASWTAVTGIWLSYIKICSESANLKLLGLSAWEPWPAETDIGLLSSKDCSCLGILKLSNICTRYLYRSCVLRATYTCEEHPRIWIYMWRKINLVRHDVCYLPLAKCNFNRRPWSARAFHISETSSIHGG